MKTYHIPFTRVQHGFFIVEAKSAEAAMEAAQNNDIEEFINKEQYDEPIGTPEEQ